MAHSVPQACLSVQKSRLYLDGAGQKEQATIPAQRDIGGNSPLVARISYEMEKHIVSE